MTKIGYAGTLVALSNGPNTLAHTVWPLIAPPIPHLPHMHAPDLILNDIRILEKDIGAVPGETPVPEQVESFYERTAEIFNRYAQRLDLVGSALGELKAALPEHVTITSDPADANLHLVRGSLRVGSGPGVAMSAPIVRVFDYGVEAAAQQASEGTEKM